MLFSIALLATTSLANAGQDLVPAWALEELEQRVRRKGAAEDLHDLAELWARIAEDEEQRALAAHVAAYDACFDAAHLQPFPDLRPCEELQPDLSEAMKAWGRAESRSLQLLRDHPEDAHAPEAVARLSWAWRRQGRDELADAAATWVAATSHDPDEIERAWVMVGDRAFEAWDTEAALEAYDRAAAVEGQLHSWVLYRRGWALHREGEYSAAIDSLKSVAAWELSPPDDGVDRRNTLLDEALQDLLRFYADAGELDQPGHGLGSKAAIHAMLTRLATAYDDQGKFEQAIQTRRRLIAEAPGPTDDNAALQAQIVDSYVAMRRFDAAVAEVERFERTYPLQVEAQAHTLALALHDAGLAAHEDALREGDPALAEQVLVLYDACLARSDEYTHEVSTYRAVLLEDLGRPEEALAAYLDNAARFPNSRYTLPVQRAIKRLQAAGVAPRTTAPTP